MKKILISGASVAGPALAFWLHRYGFDVTVVERGSAIRDGGYAVDVRGVAIDVLARMGLLEQARARQCDTQATSFIAEDGTCVATMPRGFGVFDERDVELMRGDLVRILYDATEEHVEYVFRDSIRALDQRTDGVWVSFENQPPRSFDLVIGADGVHSNVRRLTFGPEAQFREHLGSYMAVFTVDNLLALDRFQLVQNSPGRVVSVKTVKGNRQVCANVFFSSECLRFDPRDLAQQKKLVRAAFADAGWQLPALLAQMEHAADFYFDVTCQIHMPRWAQGRVALLGDAAACPSPLSGQGTSLALVAAYVLAGELASHDHEQAFARYEAQLRPFVAQNQLLAKKMADGFAPKTKRAVWSRNLSLAMLRYLPAKEWLLRQMTRSVGRAANALTLSDYDARRAA